MNTVQEKSYPVCTEKEVEKDPIGVELFGKGIVVFRDSKGVVHALEDRCPHRGAPLSKGKVVGDHVRCPYHGWTFCGSGSCRLIPGIDQKPDKKIYNISNYTAEEKYGLIWVSPADQNVAIPDIPELCNNDYSTFLIDTTVGSSMQDAIENVLDPMHTHFVHDGWIRKESERQPQKAVVTTKADSVEADYINAEPQEGLIYKLLSFNRVVEKSYGRFLSPNVIQLDYQTNKDDHLLITGFVSPINETSTRIFLFTSCKTKLPFFLIKQVVKQLFKVALKQDQEILTMLGNHKQKYPQTRKNVSTSADLLGPYVEQILAGKPLPEKTKEVLIYV